MCWLVMASGFARDKAKPNKLFSSSNKEGVATRSGSRLEDKSGRENVENEW